MKQLSIVCGLLIAAGPVFAQQQYSTSTVAGNGTAGYSGDLGPALSAEFNTPIRLALDAAGDIYVTDYLNDAVREVFANGTVNTIVGNGSAGFSGDGGPASAAQLSSPHAIALDAAGNLYIADTANCRIRRVSTSGTITTFAGTGTRGEAGDGGLAVNAQLTLPTGVAVDSNGNVYIADAGTASVRKVSPNGIISTVAGTGFLSYGAYEGEGGPATQALLGIPYSVSTDAAGNFYIGDIGLARLFKVGSDGLIHTIASNFLAQSFAVDGAGNVYFANYPNNTVQKILPTGTTLWIAGDGTTGYSGDFGPGTSAQMAQPYGVTVDAAGDVYVAEAVNAIIRKLTPAPFTIGAIANAATVQPFATPVALFGDSTVPISPGEIVTLFGAGMGPANLVVNTLQANGRLGTQLAGTTVTFGGFAAPIVYTSSGLVSAIVPYEIDGQSSVDVIVTYQGTQAAIYRSAPVLPTAPGVFTLNASGTGQALAVNAADGTLNSAANPVPIGGYVIIYETGEGDTTPTGVDGKPATAPYPMPVQLVSATVGEISALVSYAGGAPGFVAGVMQVNVQIPAGVPPGNADIQLTIGGLRSPDVTIAVQ